MELKTLVFEKPGIANTDATLRIARERAEALGIRQVVVASSHGYTAKRAKAVFEGLDVKLVAVTICGGFADKGWTMTSAERTELEGLGITVLTSIHALGDDVSEVFTPNSANKVVRETLYRFGQGMKVAVEVVIMAAEADLLDLTQEAIAVAGTDEGADTALVVRPACALQFKRFRIREILAKPR